MKGTNFFSASIVVLIVTSIGKFRESITEPFLSESSGKYCLMSKQKRSPQFWISLEEKKKKKENTSHIYIAGNIHLMSCKNDRLKYLSDYFYLSSLFWKNGHQQTARVIHRSSKPFISFVPAALFKFTKGGSLLTFTLHSEKCQHTVFVLKFVHVQSHAKG